jgi:hypothetical protein
MKRFPQLLVWLLLLQASPAVGGGADGRLPDLIGNGLAGALAGLDTIRLETGILYDRVLPLSGIERFDGSEGAPAAGAALWRQMYDELRRASSAPVPGPDLETLREQARVAAREGVVPLALLDRRYQRIRPEALERGLLRVREGRLVPGRGEPFLEARAFALAALKDRTYRGGKVVFALDAGRHLTDESAPARAIEMDFGDGRGFRPIALGQRCEVHYAGTGAKVLRVRLTGADGSVRHAAAEFTVAALQTPTPDDTLHVTAAVPHEGQYGTGDAYVYLAPGHASIENPVVVPEGFDLDNDMGWDELYALLNQEGLAESLRVGGFDAVVLDFTDATDPIQKNAFVVAELIRQVEATTGPQTSLAVVGPSMGGLCSRYALAYLESQGIGHRVRTWISFDSPHGGADIPLGVQYWMRFFSGQSADAAHLLERLNRPAARQLLVYHLTDPPGTTGEADPLRAVLLSDFAAVGGWPGVPRRVAVANGSGSRADQGFPAGDQLVQYAYGSLLVSLTGNVWAMPDQVSGTIFDGRIRILFSDTRQTVTVSGTAPFDGAPGGWRASMAEMDSSQAPYGDIVALHPHHCFIPSVSALALETTDLFYDLAGDPELPAHTPFDAVYFPAENQEHVTITAQSALWLRDEIGRGLVSVPTGPVPTAAGLALQPAAPNPFRSTTRFAFILPAPGPVDLRVFALDGREVTRLTRGPRSAGRHEVSWGGLDVRGRPAPPGLYFVRLVAGGAGVTRRVVRL